MNKFNYKKKLGQNFLFDEEILKAIDSSIEINENDLVIEIGLGTGNLTKYLVKHNSYFIGFEIDPETKKYLEQYQSSKATIIFSDFMKVNIAEIVSQFKYDNLYIIANLPYYITTPIITKIIESKVNVNKMVLMVQKEVAERLCAESNSSDYGYFTVFLNYHYRCSKLFDVSRKSFNPSPNVDSAVILLKKNYMNNRIDNKLFNQLIKDAFHLKRKNIKNNLKDYDLNLIERVLKSHNLSLISRAEEIPIEVFIELCLLMQNNK